MFEIKSKGRCFIYSVILYFFILQIKQTLAEDGTVEEIYGEIGKNTTFTCLSEFKSISWNFNGKNISGKTDRYLIISVPASDFDQNVLNDPPDPTSYSHNLHIFNIKTEDEGNFTCFNIETNSSIITYNFQPLIRPKIVEKSPKVIKVKIEKSVTLFCIIQLYPSRLFRIEWDKEEIFSSRAYLANKARISALNETHINATLTLTDVTKKENGTYGCSVVSSMVDHSIKEEFILLVLDVPQAVIDFAKAVGADKIYLNWTVNDGNDPVQHYYIQFRQEGHTTFTYYNTAIDGKNTSYVLGNFTPNTSYQLKITAKNSIGNGPANLYHPFIKTLEKDPIFIPKVEVTGSTSSTMTIGWTPPPPDLLEYVHYYELIVIEAGENPRVVEEATHQQNNRNLPYMFDHLKTATEYEFKVRACSELTKQCGPWSEVVNGTTMDGVASEPTNLKISCTHFNITRRNTITVTWSPPKQPNGKIVGYSVKVNGSALYRLDGAVKHEIWGPLIKTLDDNKYKYIIEDVKPNTNYTVVVTAMTRSKKHGDEAVATCAMPVTVPDVIGRITWSKVKTGDDKCVFKVLMPKLSERNGPICCYRIFLIRLGENSKELPLPENLSILTYHEVHSPNNTKGGAYLAEMFPGDNYRSEIFLGDGARMQLNRIDQETADTICKKCLGNMSLPMRKQKYSILTTTSKPVSESYQPIMPEISQKEHLTKAGNLTSTASKILDNKRKRKRRDPKLSPDERRDEPSSTISTLIDGQINSEIFDGFIDMSSNYTGFLEVAVEGEKKNGAVSPILTYSQYFETISPRTSAENYESSDDMAIILNIVIQVLCALILLVLVLLAALCIMHRYYSKHAVQGDEVISLRDSLSRALCGGRTSNHRHLIGTALSKPADIGPISKIDLPQAYLNRHKDTDYGFLREYEMLPNRFNDRTTKNSDAKENSHKNRYPDIKAYDQTRVKLSQINAIQGSDYINANFVIGYKERKKFICAQGPMESTIIDFWRMIWEQHLEIIVMLTNLEEYNKAKCAKYWPEKILDSKQYGDITVTFDSEHRYSDYLVRNLNVSKRTSNSGIDDEEEKRQITQYHYLVWKDFMAPEHPHGIIKFIRQINAVYSVQRGPILVHCSAGVGRTGTLVALDSLMQQLDDEGQVSIFNTVCDLRHQRNFLVQSLKQYIFLYRALLDIAQFGNTELPLKGLSAIVENLKMKPNDSKEKCKLELEFERIKQITDETNKSCSVGSGDENMSKNRSESVIPFDRNRVILTPIPSREHSTYINASFIEGYDNSESFIITQDPMENTIGDFWRMISEQGVTTLVMISEIGDGPRKCPRYWADDEIQYDHTLVKYMHSESCPYYTRREFNVTNCKINDTIKVTQFQYNGWPTVEGEVPEVCRGIIELVDQAQRHHNLEDNFSSSSPIAVHCSLGTDRSSIFVAMCILVQQLRTEKKIDICTTTRKLRSQRTMLLDTYAQYEFLHRAIANYADLHKLSLDSPSN